MEIIDRYLQAVEFWLPEKQKRDIVAELSEDLRAEMEERESALGRALTEAEVEGLLKQRGRPVLVANRYLPQRHLIGPVLFPIYVFVLKIIALCYLIPWVLVWIALTIFTPGYAAEHGGGVGAIWGQLWTSVFVSAGVTTIVFAVLERSQARSHFLEAWDPRKLPPLRRPSAIGRVGASIEMAVNLAAAVWWSANMRGPLVWPRPRVEIAVSGVWPWFYWGFLVLCVANTALAAVAVLRPWWSTRRAILRLTTDLAGGVLFCWLLQAQVVTGLSIEGVGAARAAEIAAGIDGVLVKLLPLGILFTVVIGVVNGYRIVRVHRERRSVVNMP